MTIAEVLISGRHVLVSDSDVVWLHDPTPELELLARQVRPRATIESVTRV